MAYSKQFLRQNLPEQIFPVICHLANVIRFITVHSCFASKNYTKLKAQRLSSSSFITEVRWSKNGKRLIFKKQCYSGNIINYREVCRARGDLDNVPRSPCPPGRQRERPRRTRCVAIVRNPAASVDLYRHRAFQLMDVRTPHTDLQDRYVTA